MAQYQSSYTGEQIDSAVLKSINTVASYTTVSANTTVTPTITSDGVQNFIYKNTSSSDITLAISTTNTVIVDDNDSITLKSDKYAEISFLRIGTTYYVRSAVQN